MKGKRAPGGRPLRAPGRRPRRRTCARTCARRFLGVSSGIRLPARLSRGEALPAPVWAARGGDPCSAVRIPSRFPRRRGSQPPLPGLRPPPRASCRPRPSCARGCFPSRCPVSPPPSAGPGAGRGGGCGRPAGGGAAGARGCGRCLRGAGRRGAGWAGAGRRAAGRGGRGSGRGATGTASQAAGRRGGGARAHSLPPCDWLHALTCAPGAGTRRGGLWHSFFCCKLARSAASCPAGCLAVTETGGTEGNRRGAGRGGRRRRSRHAGSGSQDPSRRRLLPEPHEPRGPGDVPAV